MVTDAEILTLKFQLNGDLRWDEAPCFLNDLITCSDI